MSHPETNKTDETSQMSHCETNETNETNETVVLEVRFDGVALRGVGGKGV